jgi:hypothetical protein
VGDFFPFVDGMPHPGQMRCSHDQPPFQLQPQQDRPLSVVPSQPPRTPCWSCLWGQVLQGGRFTISAPPGKGAGVSVRRTAQQAGYRPS